MTVDRGEFFREVTLRICSSLDIEQALMSTFEYIRQFMPADAMSMNYVDVPRRLLFPVARAAREGYVALWRDMSRAIPLEDDFVRFFEAVERSGRAVTVVNDPRELPPPARRAFPELASLSTLALMLNIRGEPMGSLAISAKGPNRFLPEHVALLEGVKDPVALAMSNARRFMELQRMKDRLAEDNEALSADLERLSGVEVIGADFGLREVMEMVRRGAATNSPVLLLGETGTGKEVIAGAIHMASPRRAGPLIRLQCGAVPETLLDSELFGHEKGAFTGATERKRGRFERAHHGTLFLDEIGELSPEAQVKLLRVLQDKQFERVGGTQTVAVDVRVIAATHRDLEKMVREGKFREDLWYRLNVFPVRIPPLRLRRDDIPSLVQYFIERKAREMNLGTVPRIGRESLARMIAYDWPGNVRELQNIVERALILSRGAQLEIPALRASARPADDTAMPMPYTTLGTLDAAITAHIRAALERTGGKVSGPGGAAEMLGINPSTLRFRMKKLQVRLSSPRRSLSFAAPPRDERPLPGGV